MFQPKRKKIDNNSKLAPIDEGLLKSKSKLMDVDHKNNEQDTENQGVLAPLAQKNPSKSKRVFDIPAIDHSKQRAKLEEIVQKTENTPMIGNLTASNFPVPKQQLFGKVPQTMTFTNMKQAKNALVSADDQKKLDQKRKKVMSHQDTKNQGHNGSQSEERTTADNSQYESKNGIEKPKKTHARGSNSTVRLARKQKSEGNPSIINNSEKPTTAGSNKGESRWLKELARQNYKYFVEKLNQQEAQRRINIIRAVKKQLTDRFMKVFRLFRNKKYGEPIDSIPKPQINSYLNENNTFDEEDLKKIRKAKKGGKGRGSQLDKQDLITVIEEQEESVVESEQDQIKTKPDCQEFIQNMIEEGIVYEFVLLLSDNILKVKSFLLMVIQRRRYLKMKEKSVKVQAYLRRFISRRKVKREVQQIKDDLYTKQLQDHLNKLKSQEELINSSAIKIQSLYHRLKLKKGLKDMRQKMKTLPYVCRNSYVKMQILKINTFMLATDTSKLRK
ncbi:UNKNOWN [Stylonychia lemnae]|uniref:Uncharacterized protein n=1 Tax=Stylonychia lemnae TaxID=5949 RepID=A0A078AVK2_STYLE|nr:UNKNOWN [Stylonychia lemnae]|eukprot:CDW84853.1 UNKNOWN [Stylonychia lemnae]